MSLKEEFKFKDRLIKGIDPDGRFKISVVKTRDVAETARQNHNLSLLNTVLLGKSLTAAMLLAAELKGEERIRLRLEGSGPVGMITSEANRVGEIRGFAQNPQAEIDYTDSDASISDGLGVGLLTVSKTLYNEAEPKTSTIQLAAGDVTTDIAHYMVQSEQILSATLIDISLNDDGSVKQSGGLMLQRLPGAEDSDINRIHETITALPPLSSLFDEGSYIDEIMEMAVSPLKVKELDRQPVHFFCRCSEKRFKNALSMLSYEDLKEMKGESQEVVCHYCNNRMVIPKNEIEKFIKTAKAKMN